MRARAAIATVIAEGLVGRLTFGMVSFALPLYAYALGLSLRQIGVLVSLRTLVVLPFKPVAGWCADRVGMRTVYLAGIAIRAASAVVLLFAGGFEGLMVVRMLQGASSAARDVASLGTIARESRDRVGAHYGWYAGAKQVGNVTGAAAAGFLIAAGGGRLSPEAYRPLFLLVLALSAAPFVVAWFGLREDASVPRPATAARPAARRGRRALDELRGLAGASSVGMLVATSAYMVHGLYPVLATQYAHLSEVQAGVVYSASGLAFVVAAPSFGWLIDRRGRRLALALRSLCNIGSSLLYVAAPFLPGMAAARTIDDSGKAAFQPAWASVVAETAGTGGPSSGRRLATLDTAATVGEAIGPALATLLWQSGGIFLLFGVRIAISAAAELAALRVFGERRPAVVPAPAEAS